MTAHRFAGDRVVPYQATLQTGTPVLVDQHGVPRVRCAGATPLAPPRGTAGEPNYLETPWPGFDPAALVTVRPSAGTIRQFGLITDGHPFRRPAGSTGDRDLEQVPARAVIDGTYELTGKLSACDLRGCEKVTARTLKLTVSGCPDHCGMVGDDWSGSSMLVESAGAWTSSGPVLVGWFFICDGTPVPTVFSLTLRVTSGKVLDGVWTAEQLAGTYSKRSSRTPSCGPGVLTWDLAGTRR